MKTTTRPYSLTTFLRSIRKCKRENVFACLDRFFRRPDVMSIEVESLDVPYPKSRFFAAALGRDVLFIVIDRSHTERDILVDEESFNDENPLYFTECSHFESPVFRITEVRDAFMNKFQDPGPFFNSPRILYLAEANLINEDDMQELWADMRVTGRGLITAVEPKFKHHFEKHYKDELESLCNQAIQYVASQIAWRTPIEEIQDTGAEEEPLDSFSESATMPMELPYYGSIYDYIHPDDPLLKPVSKMKNEFGEEYTLRGAVPLPLCQIINPVIDVKAEFERLTGLDDLKETIRRFTALQAYNCMRESLGYRRHEINLHSVFAGNVGCGKSTAMRLLGSALRDAGMLSKGHVVLCDRSSFVGSYWGSTAQNLRILLKVAQGGVLAIDEAYLLDGNHRRDPGKMVLPMLLDTLADTHNRDLCVILAGYPKKMERLLETNAGLASRFKNRFLFPDFSRGQLLEITEKRLAADGYHFSAEAREKYGRLLDDALAKRDETFGNGRFVANVLEEIYLLHAHRTMEGFLWGDELLEIQPTDIPESH